MNNSNPLGSEVCTYIYSIVLSKDSYGNEIGIQGINDRAYDVFEAGKIDFGEYVVLKEAVEFIRQYRK